MKRNREDDAAVEEKSQLREDYSFYLGNRHDKAQLLANHNPNRLKNALFELSFYLNINHINRENSWKYLERVDMVKRAPDVASLFVQVIACIWIAQNTSNSINPFKISFLLNSLSKVTSSITQKGHQLYSLPFFSLVMTELSNILEILQVTGPICQKLQLVLQEYQDSRPLFENYTRIFKIILKFDFSDSQNEVFTQQGSSVLLDVFRYGWLFILFFAECNHGEFFKTHRGSCAGLAWAVLFIASQMNDSHTRSISEVVEQAKLMGGDVSKINILHGNKCWKDQAGDILRAMAYWMETDDEYVIEQQPFFLEFLTTFKSGDFFKHSLGDDIPVGFPWTINLTALDGGPTGLLQANMQALVNSWDAVSKRKQQEIDLLAFVPSWDRAAATPMRFMRTPGKSIASKSSARNVFRTGRSHGSGMNKNMAATPWSAANLCGMRPAVSAPICSEILLSSISKLLSCMDPNTIIATLPTVQKERVRSLIAEVKSKSSSIHAKAVWDFTLPIYNELNLKVSLLAERYMDSKLYKDDSLFDRAIICISLEIVRFIYDVKYIGLEALIKLTGASFMDISVLIKLIIEHIIKPPLWPRELVKRLMGVYERLMESDIWTEPAFSQFLQSNGSQATDSTLYSISWPLKLYGKVKHKLDSSFMLYGIQFQNLNQTEFMGYLQLYHNVISLAKNRINRFCVSDGLELSQACHDQAWDIMLKCIKNEHSLRLIANRHLDVLVICSIYMASRIIEGGKNNNFMKILIDTYTTYPQYLRSTLFEIFVAADSTSTIQITEFYSSIFLPIIRPFVFPAKENVMGSDFSYLNMPKEDSVPRSTFVAGMKPPFAAGSKTKKRCFGNLNRFPHLNRD